MEEDLAQQQEDRFRVGDFLRRVVGEVGDANQCGGDGAEGRDGHPADADPAAGLGVCRAAQCHEPDDDMRLAEVAQAPCCGRDDAQKPESRRFHTESVEEVQGPGLGCLDAVDGGADAAGGNDAHDRHGDQGNEHQQALGDVGQRGADESTEECVAQGDHGNGDHADGVVPAEGALEELTRGDHAGGDVEGEEHQDDRRGGDAQHMGFILEPLLEEAGDGDRVLRDLRVGAQAWGDELPVQPGADGQADGDPGFDEAGGVDGSGQAQQQPAGHIRGTCGKCRDTGLEPTAGEHVVVEVRGLAVGVIADPEHGGEVYDNRHHLECLFRHGVPQLAGRWNVRPGKPRKGTSGQLSTTVNHRAMRVCASQSRALSKICVIGITGVLSFRDHMWGVPRQDIGLILQGFADRGDRRVLCTGFPCGGEGGPPGAGGDFDAPQSRFPVGPHQIG